MGGHSGGGNGEEAGEREVIEARELSIWCIGSGYLRATSFDISCNLRFYVVRAVFFFSSCDAVCMRATKRVNIVRFFFFIMSWFLIESSERDVPRC
jgi:hypothetical protein